MNGMNITNPAHPLNPINPNNPINSYNIYKEIDAETQTLVSQESVSSTKISEGQFLSIVLVASLLVILIITWGIKKAK